MHKPGVYTLFIKNMEEKVEKIYRKKKRELSFLILEIAVDFSCGFVIIDMKMRRVRFLPKGNALICS